MTVADLDNLWTIVAAALVFFMQLGFLLLEAGSVRSKNSINVAQKNLVDFFVSTVLFGAVGFAVMFGISSNGLIGFDAGLSLFWGDPDLHVPFFVLQLMFCGTAATIISGACAERLRVGGFVWLVAFMAMFVYPIFGHWVWGDLIHADNAPLLADLGFVDLAGATAVHSVGAWAALAALIVLGPRIGRYENGRPVQMQGHSPLMAAGGALVLWIGWIGFNGGTLSVTDERFGRVILNTLVAGGIGGITQLLIGYWRTGYFIPQRSINGLLAGLVGITAGAHMLTPSGAAAVAILAAIGALLCERVLEELRIDDAIGAVPVHGGGAAVGTIALALFAPAEVIANGDRLAFLLIQSAGAGLSFIWAFGTMFVFCWAVDVFLKRCTGRGLRVHAAHEIEGLNTTEHAATFGIGVLHAALYRLAKEPSSFSTRLDVEPGDEIKDVADLFNVCMDKLEDAHKSRTVQLGEYARQAEDALAREKDITQQQREFISMASHEFRTPLAIIDGNAQRMKRGVERGSIDPDRTLAGIEKIRRSVKRVTSLMESLLSASRLDAGDIPIHLNELDLAALVNDVCGEHQELCKNHQIQVDAAPLPRSLNADGGLLRLVFVNLLSNATKYSPDGGTVQVDGWMEQNVANIRVRDQGVGIPPDEVPKLFTRFFRASTSSGIGGSGIGLHLIKHIAQRHGGDITVESEVGVGSSFTVVLPLMFDNVPAADTNISMELGDAGATS